MYTGYQTQGWSIELLLAFEGGSLPWCKMMVVISIYNAVLLGEDFLCGDISHCVMTISQCHDDGTVENTCLTLPHGEIRHHLWSWHKCDQTWLKHEHDLKEQVTQNKTCYLLNAFSLYYFLVCPCNGGQHLSLCVNLYTLRNYGRLLLPLTFQ